MGQDLVSEYFLEEVLSQIYKERREQGGREGREQRLCASMAWLTGTRKMGGWGEGRTPHPLLCWRSLMG